MASVLHVLPHPGGGAETYIDLLEELDGYDHERIALAASRSRLRGLAALPARWRPIAARAATADIVHVHGDTAAMLAAPLLRGKPSLVTTHGLHRLGRGGGVLARRAMRRAVSAASRTICTSAAERGELAAVLPDDLTDRLVVIPNGAPPAAPATDAERDRARAELSIASDQIVALFVGRLEARKEPMTAVEAAERVHAAGSPIVLLVVGDGPLERTLAARTSASVRPLGFRRDIDGLFAAADVFMLPSRREGMSMALLAAMSHGLAALVSDAPGNVEAVGDAGLVVPSGADAAAGGLARLASEPDTRARLGELARSRIATALSASRFRERTREVYERALAAREAPPPDPTAPARAGAVPPA